LFLLLLPDRSDLQKKSIGKEVLLLMKKRRRRSLNEKKR
jgi:hypothetical protein